MRNVTLRSLQATTVIAAVLALGSTPAFAQDASAPMVDAPPAASAPIQPQSRAAAEAPALTSPAPQIVLPDVSAPAAQAPEAPEAPAPVAAAPKASVTRTERHVVKQAAAKRIEAPAPAAVIPSAAPQAGPVVAAPAKPIAMPAKTLSDRDAFNSGSRIGDAQPDQDIKAAPLVPGDSGMYAGGAVIVLGLGAAALFAARRRKAGGQADEPARMTVPIVPAAAEPAFVPERSVAPVRTPAPAARVASGPVPTGEAREALLQQMADAAPDAENPFTSSKARRHRARLILQAREQRETQQPFDFRKYQSPIRATGAEAHRNPSPVDA